MRLSVLMGMKQRTSDSPSWTSSPIISGSERYLFIVVTLFFMVVIFY